MLLLPESGVIFYPLQFTINLGMMLLDQKFFRFITDQNKPTERRLSLLTVIWEHKPTTIEIRPMKF